MKNIIIYGMVYLGSALMVYNIYGFVRFAVKVQGRKNWGKGKSVLHLPIVLLVFFLLGYLAVGIFGNPDLIVSGILFGGSIFVFIMYNLINRITKRIAENERLEAELKTAEESNRIKTDFLSTVSHEMRTPMNVIIGLDSLALNSKELPEETRAYLEKIGFSARQLLGLINNILDLNEIDTGKITVNNKDFYLSETINQINAIAEALCEDKGIEYRVEGCEKAQGYYTGDEALIKKVIVSVIENAVKYTDAPGSVELSVDCSDNPDGEKVFCFAVKDTGIGIDSDFLPKIFDAFTREDSSSTSRYGGSGLGLALTKNTVELMGGTIVAESTKGVGSTFTVSLPLSVATPKENAGVTENAVDSLEGRRILIVEDLPENAEIVADLLDLEGAESEHAENGRIAVDMFSNSPEGYYDAILMDLRMPVMDGITATREIRKLDRADAATVPIIALTANAFASDVEQSISAGMNAHLAKPADSDLLYATLKTYIGKR